jgi:ACS family hexuronate transporter-like MFS transporter
MTELQFEEDNYGDLEAWFGAAFAIGAIVSGVIADRINVRWVYPAMVVLWSLAGGATLFVRNYEQLLACRIMLGFFEAANWPCSLRVTQRILSKEQRTLGNSVLQSGTALGSILTPPLVWFCLKSTGDWRIPFSVVAVCGCCWAVIWFVLVRSADMALPAESTTPGREAKDRVSYRAMFAVLWPKFLALGILVVAINASWHFLRAWLPLFLQNGHGYSENSVLWFSSAYYIAAGAGSLGAGVLTSFFIGKGGGVHRSRMAVLAIFGVLMLLSIPVAFLDSGWLLIVLLLILGFAALAVFPNYYSFTQEISVKHQGKISGILGFVCWAALFVMHKRVGHFVQFTKGLYYADALASGLEPVQAMLAANRHAYLWVIAPIGVLPLIGFVTMARLWNFRTAKLETLTEPVSPDGTADLEKERDIAGVSK